MTRRAALERLRDGLCQAVDAVDELLRDEGIKTPMSAMLDGPVATAEQVHRALAVVLGPSDLDTAMVDHRAQLTDTGRPRQSVYFIHAPAADAIKIGTSHNPLVRLCDLQGGSGEGLELLGAIPGSEVTESLLHAAFARDRSHREWFRASERLTNFVARACTVRHEAGTPPTVSPAVRLHTHRLMQRKGMIK